LARQSRASAVGHGLLKQQGRRVRVSVSGVRGHRCDAAAGVQVAEIAV